ncbi:DUF6414 family protein [Microbacterium sorbitolivorans]|uniref:Uncharacterized protein n=1 Tax=Microbacterium sorbitolivorans TaxID=1867410 RepID=A0A367Y6U0_9MICO|nr:hypothetical protein [Microbacterium sorbitolivorans]RCK61558.1 hypothetical protein DTO57_02685 [Microbacterium sorbitolivorans]
MSKAPTKADLREFIYLDEVSLRSLLSSLTGDLRDSASEQSSDELQAEIASGIKAGNALVGAEANVSSRFQATNNSTIQTSRKATVQSWFREFHALKGIRLIEVTRTDGPAFDQAALLSTTDKSLLLRNDELGRGELVEFRVRLSADPVYQLGAMVSEFSGMADEYPDMFKESGALASLREAQPIGKVLDRFLVGLIPIRAVVLDYSIVTIGEEKFIAHNDLITGLSLVSEPLEIVGVTEQAGYWKDLRRVLFSEAEVTLMGRVSRAGVQAEWTPVKLADLFKEMVPGLVAQINAAGRTGTQVPQPQPNADSNRLTVALNAYASGILEYKRRELTQREKQELDLAVAALRGRSGSVSEQHSAFAVIRSRISELTGVTVGPKRELAIREQARVSSGLPLFPALAASTDAPAPPPQTTVSSENLIDVEIIAIYW